MTLGSHDHLDVVGLEVPDQLAHRWRVAERATGDEDDLGVVRTDQRRGARSTRRGPGRRRAVATVGVADGRERAEHVVAEPRSRGEHAGDRVDVVGAADDHGALAEGAQAAGAVQPAAQHEAADGQQRRADQEGEDEEAAGELELGEVAADAERRGGQAGWS